MSTHEINVFHYSSTDNDFVRRQTQRALQSNEVLIKTTHSGLCFTDVHAKHTGCGLGHEGVGIIEEIGEDVNNLKIGQRVGWGWLHSSCASCLSCKRGYRQYCAQATGFAFGETDQGAFSSHRIIDSTFAYPIPESISSSHAAPLMCAGASVYEALAEGTTEHTRRVGVIGLGGLGHMAVLFARKIGYTVSVVFADSSREPMEDKIAAAHELGADQVLVLSTGTVARSGAAETGQIAGADGIDTLLITSNDLPDWNKVLRLLNRQATIVLMSITSTELRIPYMDFILPGHKIIASTEARQGRHVEMLEFAAEKGIKPWVEEFEMTEDGLQHAFKKLETGKMRFRGVLKVPEAGIRANAN